MKGILAILAKSKPGSREPDDGSGEDSRDEEAPESGDLPSSSREEYASELADILNVKERDRDAFREALHGYVMACYEDETEEE